MKLEKELEQLIREPFRQVKIITPYSGQISFSYFDNKIRERRPTVQEEESVLGPGGQWNEIEGSPLYEITRQGSPEVIYSPTNGTVHSIHTELEGTKVQALTEVMIIRHPLTEQETLDHILKKTLSRFTAPEDATYFYTPEFEQKLRVFGKGGFEIKPGDNVVIMSFMKRDIPLVYKGPVGIVYSIFFSSGMRIEKGNPILGICSPEIFEDVKKIERFVSQTWNTPK